MAGYSPVPLPPLSTLFDPTVSNFAGAPAPLPSIGLVMNPSAAKTLAAAVGEFRLTGVVASLKEGHKLASAAGSFTLTGVDATLTYVSSGTGVDAPAPLPSMTLVLGRATGDKLLGGATGTFNLTGIAESLNTGLALSAAAASYVLSGAPALRDMQVTADKGTFADTSNAATLSKSSPGVSASTGTFTLTGNTAGLAYQTATGKVLTSTPGSFVLTGNNVVFPTTIARILTCDRGTYALTGSNATLTYVGWQRIAGASSTWTNVTGATTTWTQQ